MAQKLFLIDGSALYYRSYFAFINNPLINSKGEDTSATYGFLNSLLKLIEDEYPQYLAIIFDTKEPTFRHELYPEYKATREKMPEEMAAQYPRLVETLKTLKFNLLEKDGYEADDVIGTLAKRFASENLDVFIVSGDKDMAQLVNDHIFLYNPGKSNQEAEVLGREEVEKKMGVRPEQIVDWLSLMGDKSDNVPGIPKVGKVTAQKLLRDYQSLDGIYEQIDRLGKKQIRENLINYKDQAITARELVTIHTDVPIEVPLEQIQFTIWEADKADHLMKELEFRRMPDRVLKIAREFGAADNFEVYEEKKSDYHLINDTDSLEWLLKELRKQEQFAFDLETSSLDFSEAEIAGISFCWKAHEAWYLVLNHPDGRLNVKEVLERLQPIFEDRRINKIGQNIKFDALMLAWHEVKVEGIYFDTMIASYLIDPGVQHNLDKMAEYYLNYEMIPIEEVIGRGRKQKKMTELPAEEVYRYGAEDADVTFQLYEIFKDKIKQLQMESLFYDLEIPLIPVLLEMELTGVKLDTDILKKLSKQLSGDIEHLKKDIFERAGQSFNLNSPQQLGPVLFDKLKIHEDLDLRKPPRTKTGQYSTSERVLERYREHPIIQQMMEFRKLTKLQNTYVDALPQLIRPNTGKVHTSFNQTKATTGRLSSSNPNLQNIPIRTELGREIRKAFVASRNDYLIMSADYSQIELRIMAHLSGDDTMIDHFNNNRDIHAATASLIFDIPAGNVESDHRRKAKEINFGIIYGMSKYGLANRLNISVEEAEEFIIDYLATYPKISQYMEAAKAQVKEQGFVETMMHRRRYLPEINSNNQQMREFAERTAINTPIQGSAAELIKKAMMRLHTFILREKSAAAMLLQVHDELVFEVPRSEAGAFSKTVKDIMESAADLNVPLVADCGTGNNWLEAHQ